MKVFNTVSVVLSALGGFLASYMGGFDVLLRAILILVIIDYSTGLIKAGFMKELSSKVGMKGIVKKVMVFIVIATTCTLDSVIQMEVPLREVVIMFFIVNEGISILENAAHFVKIPDKIKEMLIQIRG